MESYAGGKLEHIVRHPEGLSRSKAMRYTEKEGVSNNTVYGYLRMITAISLRLSLKL